MPIEGELDLDRLAGACSRRTRAIVVNTPNNPTGRVLTQRELEAIEAQIEAAEARNSQAEIALGDPQTYAAGPQRVPELQRQLDESAAEVERLYARWQELQDLLTPA